MIIVFKTNVGTAAYDSETIMNITYSPNLGMEITYTSPNKIDSKVFTARHFLANDKEFDKILEQWKQSKETNNA
jgi:hypothetical protein